MDKTEYWQMLQYGLDRDGIEFILNTLQEECAELIVAISHLRRGRVTIDEVVEEMADVRMMTDMAKLGLVGDHEFLHVIFRKAVRLGRKIKWSNGDENERVEEPVQIEPRPEVVDSGHYERSVRSRSYLEGTGDCIAPDRQPDIQRGDVSQSHGLPIVYLHENGIVPRSQRGVDGRHPIQSQERKHVHGRESGRRGNPRTVDHACRHLRGNDLSGPVRGPAGSDSPVSGVKDTDDPAGTGPED